VSVICSVHLNPTQPGVGSSLLISDLNSPIKYNGGAKNLQTFVPLWIEFETWSKCQVLTLVPFLCLYFSLVRA
jgi:hypothetical protein